MVYHIGCGRIMLTSLHQFFEMVCNLSSRTQCWPRSWKESNINPIPEVEAPMNDVDFRGIRVT